MTKRQVCTVQAVSLVMTSTPASALCSSMKAFPLVLIVMAVLSVSGKATSVQNDPDRESAYREYRGDTADEDNVARPLDSIGGHENKQEDTQRLQDILERSEEQRLQNWRQYFAHANRDRLGRLHSFGRTLDSTGGGGRQLLRDLDGLPHFPRRTRSGLDSLSGVTFGWNKRLDSLSGITFGNQKRNFDEIDRSGFNGFVKKNFDEIDRSGFDGFVKKNFDEIDRVGFGSFVKRNAPQLLARSYDKDNH